MKEAAAVKEEEEEVLGGLPCLGCGENPWSPLVRRRLCNAGRRGVIKLPVTAMRRCAANWNHGHNNSKGKSMRCDAKHNRSLGCQSPGRARSCITVR